jgi:hypothetical protein
MSVTAAGTATATATAKTWNVWLYVLMGVGAAVAGLLPWIITGMRLPLQNLWADEGAGLAEPMPFVLLPFSQYFVTLLIGVIAVGSALGGLVARLTKRHRPRFGTAAVAVGVLLVQLIAVIQTASVVEDGLRETSATELYFYGLTGGAVASIVVGMLVLGLIAAAPAAGALVGTSLAAVALGPWLSGLILPHTLQPVPPEFLTFLQSTSLWIPAIVVGLTIAWCGLKSAGRIVAALFSLLVLWIGPVTFTAVTSSIGSRGLARYPAEMLEYGLQVFQAALLEPGVSLRYVALATVVAALGLAARALRTRSGGGGVRAVDVGERDGVAERSS